MSSSMIVGFVGMMIPATAAGENCLARKAKATEELDKLRC